MKGYEIYKKSLSLCSGKINVTDIWIRLHYKTDVERYEIEITIFYLIDEIDTSNFSINIYSDENGCNFNKLFEKLEIKINELSKIDIEF